MGFAHFFLRSLSLPSRPFFFYFSSAGLFPSQPRSFFHLSLRFSTPRAFLSLPRFRSLFALFCAFCAARGRSLSSRLVCNSFSRSCFNFVFPLCLSAYTSSPARIGVCGASMMFCDRRYELFPSLYYLCPRVLPSLHSCITVCQLV